MYLQPHCSPSWLVSWPQILQHYKNTTYRKHRGCMNMDDALNIWTSCMYCCMQHEASHIDTKICSALLYHFALYIYLHKTGCCDFMIQHTEWVH